MPNAAKNLRQLQLTGTGIVSHRWLTGGKLLSVSTGRTDVSARHFWANFPRLHSHFFISRLAGDLNETLHPVDSFKFILEKK